MYRHVHWVSRLGASHRAVPSWEEHVRLIEALEAHDPAAAQEAARDHAAESAAIGHPGRPDED